MSAYDTYMGLVKQAAKDENTNSSATHAGVGAAAAGGAGLYVAGEHAHMGFKSLDAAKESVRGFAHPDYLSELTREGHKAIRRQAGKDVRRAGVLALGGAALGAAAGYGFGSKVEKQQ